MLNCLADKGIEVILILGVSETPPGWSSICNLGQYSRLEHSMQSRRRHVMATKGMQSIQTRAQPVTILSMWVVNMTICKTGFL